MYKHLATIDFETVPRVPRSTAYESVRTRQHERYLRRHVSLGWASGGTGAKFAVHNCGLV